MIFKRSAPILLAVALAFIGTAASAATVGELEFHGRVSAHYTKGIGGKLDLKARGKVTGWHDPALYAWLDNDDQVDITFGMTATRKKAGARSAAETISVPVGALRSAYAGLAAGDRSGLSFLALYIATHSGIRPATFGGDLTVTPKLWDLAAPNFGAGLKLALRRGDLDCTVDDCKRFGAKLALTVGIDAPDPLPGPAVPAPIPLPGTLPLLGAGLAGLLGLRRWRRG